MLSVKLQLSLTVVSTVVQPPIMMIIVLGSCFGNQIPPSTYQ